MVRTIGIAAAVAIGLFVAIWGSRIAVRAASRLAAGSRVPPFVIGLTLIALGTDLPEIANSVISSISGHGDLNIGDSVGSVVTQSTLVVGLLPFIAGGFFVGRRGLSALGGATMIGLGAGVILMADGFLSRFDAGVLIGLWVLLSAGVWRFLPTSGEPELPLRGGMIRRLGLVLGGLAMVVTGASAAVWGLISIADQMGVPEYILSFFGASIGTSLPELAVTITALRRGDRELAIGDAFGSSLMDATLSIGSGPLVAPVAVTSALAVRGSLAAMAVIGLVVILLVARERHDRRSGLVLLLLYAAFYPLLLA